MGIQFAIHTYGYHDSMFYVLNGIKMIMNHGFTDAMIKLMAMIATSYYVLLGMAGAHDGRTGAYFLKTAGMIMVITALLLPKADMLVIDRVTKKQEKVDGLLYAFVLPVGALEAFGAGITSLFEQAFSTVDSAPYKDYGMIFGQRIVQESKNWKIANPEFAKNMDIFLERCVVLEAMIGTRFTPIDAMKSDDLFTLVTQNAGTFRKVNFQIGNKSSKLTCKEAANQLKTYLGLEMTFLNSKYKRSDFNLAGSTLYNDNPITENAKLNRLLAQNLEIGYKSTLGIDSKAEDIVRQNMMINALKGFNNKSDLYGYTRASQIQNSNWAISGELAKEYLPLLLNIIKALVYASFIFLVPLMILQGGIGKYLKYCIVVFSLQIWPALNSILNLFIELYSNIKGAGITGGALTYGNFNQAHQVVETIVLVASGLQMSIPFLSFAIVQGGVESFVQLAGSVQAASAGASSIASNEITSGSRSFDNISRGNESIDQKGGFKTDWNQSFQEGARQVQGASGAMYRSFADGSSAINSGVGVDLSSGSRRFGLESSTQAGYQQNLTNTLSAIQGAELNFNKAKSATISSAGDLVSHIAQRESAGETFNYEQLGEQGKVLQQAVNYTKELHDHNGYGWEQAGQAGVKTSISGGFGMPQSSPIKADFSVGTDASVTASNTSNQSLSEEERVSTSNDTNKIFNNIAKAAQNENWMKDNSIDTSFAQSTRANYDQMQSYQQSITQKREEAESYSAALNYAKNSGASDSRDMYHEVEQGIMNQYGVSQNEAHKMIENNDPRANRVWDGIVHQNMSNIMHKVGAGRAHIDNKATTDAALFHNENYKKIDDQNVKDLTQTAKNQGLDKAQMQAGMTNTQVKLTDQANTIIKTNEEQTSAVEHHNKTFNQNLQQRANKYEKDRIGQGKIVGSNFGIGGPNLEEKTQINLEKNLPPLPSLNSLKNNRENNDK